MGDPGIIPPAKIGGQPGQAPGLGEIAGHAAGIAFGRRGDEKGSRPLVPRAEGYDTQDLNQIQFNARQWYNWTCDRPTILLPIVSSVVSVLSGQEVAGAQYEIYYAPNRQPVKLPAAGTAEDAMLYAQVSRGCGVVYLPRAGRWSLYWNAPNNSSKLRMLILDATNPSVAARYLFEEGIHQVSVNGTTGDGTITACSAVDSVCLASNRLRKGFQITIDAAAGVANFARLGFNAAANPGKGVKLGTANEPSTFGMSGENCFKGEIHIITGTGSVGDPTCSVVEWY